ncbi:MAG: substrate-binding domain-containing protein [Flavobacteriales bacterium]
MQNNKTIRVGGVPEHFNLPWHLAKDSTLFKQKGLKISWTDFKGGTGEMTQALRNNLVDIAIVLTEGIVADIVKGNQAKLIGVYVKSPLQWGIHVANHSAIYSPEDIKGKTAAISRYGSGSHLMSYVNADNKEWPIHNLKFEVIRNLDGGRKALKEGTADYFMWEKYTTKPFVDNGEFRRVDVCPTPWPSFMIAVRTEFLEENEELIEHLLETIYQSNYAFINNPDSCMQISELYNLKFEDVKKWYSETEWAIDEPIDLNMLNMVQERLVSLDIIPNKIDSKSFVWNRCLSEPI